MSSTAFRIIDSASFDVLADVDDDGDIEDFLLANQRYEVARVPFADFTVVKTTPISSIVLGT